MITMTEIAKLTGVSQPTVSRVLNGNQAVNPKIRERVLACAREHNFQPNIMAQSLVGSKTHLIGVILTDISNSFFADLVKYLEQEARKAGYSLILFNSNYKLEQEAKSLSVVQRYRVDGLIVVPVDVDAKRWKEIIEQLLIPTVVITREAPGLDSVYVSHREAGAQVGRHLWEKGYREYLFFGNTKDAKYKGFAQALSSYDPHFIEHLNVITSKKEDDIQEALEIYFSKKRARTGIFAYNDRRAVQMMGHLKRMGIEIPREVGLVGFDNTYICDFLYPRLSSVSQPNEEMATLAMRRLLEKIEHPDRKEVEHYPLETTMIARDSS